MEDDKKDQSSGCNDPSKSPSPKLSPPPHAPSTEPPPPQYQQTAASSFAVPRGEKHAASSVNSPLRRDPLPTQSPHTAAASAQRGGLNVGSSPPRQHRSQQPFISAASPVHGTPLRAHFVEAPITNTGDKEKDPAAASGSLSALQIGVLKRRSSGGANDADAASGVLAPTLQQQQQQPKGSNNGPPTIYNVLGSDMSPLSPPMPNTPKLCAKPLPHMQQQTHTAPAQLPAAAGEGAANVNDAAVVAAASRSSTPLPPQSQPPRSVARDSPLRGGKGTPPPVPHRGSSPLRTSSATLIAPAPAAPPQQIATPSREPKGRTIDEVAAIYGTNNNNGSGGNNGNGSNHAAGGWAPNGSPLVPTGRPRPLSATSLHEGGSTPSTPLRLRPLPPAPSTPTAAMATATTVPTTSRGNGAAVPSSAEVITLQPTRHFDAALPTPNGRRPADSPLRGAAAAAAATPSNAPHAETPRRAAPLPPAEQQQPPSDLGATKGSAVLAAAASTPAQTPPARTLSAGSAFEYVYALPPAVGGGDPYGASEAPPPLSARSTSRQTTATTYLVGGILPPTPSSPSQIAATPSREAPPPPQRTPLRRS